MLQTDHAPSVVARQKCRYDKYKQACHWSLLKPGTVPSDGYSTTAVAHGHTSLEQLVGNILEIGIQSHFRSLTCYHWHGQPIQWSVVSLSCLVHIIWYNPSNIIISAFLMTINNSNITYLCKIATFPHKTVGFRSSTTVIHGQRASHCSNPHNIH